MRTEVSLSEIAVGDEAVCLVPIEGFLTAGKTYPILGIRHEENRIVVTDDRGLEGWFNHSRFRYVMHVRDLESPSQ